MSLFRDKSVFQNSLFLGSLFYLFDETIIEFESIYSAILLSVCFYFLMFLEVKQINISSKFAIIRNQNSGGFTAKYYECMCRDSN